MASSFPQQRVVVTGIGLITPFGSTREPSWDALKRGESATRWLRADELNLSAADGDRLLAGSWKFAGASASRTDSPLIVAGETFDEPVLAMAVKAATEAFHDAELKVEQEDRTRLGCVVGTSKGGIQSFSRAIAAHGLGTEGQGVQSVNVWTQFPPNMPSLIVAAQHGLEGPCLCPVAACATGLVSLNRGFELIRDGHCDVVLAGSSDASLCTSVLASFHRLGVLARGFDDPATACRPFDRHRSGFVIGEGAAMLVLERLERAVERGAHIYAEWITSGYAADVSGLTQLEENSLGLVRLIRDVLRRAGLTASEIDYVNLHGTATRQNDLCETNALKQAFGTAANSLRCSSLKGGVGHLLGAAGSVEVAATMLAMRDGVIPPTVNLTEPDSNCDLDYTPGSPRPQRIENALKLSLGFGGHLVAAIVREFTG
jgi:3-oxoacyl-[acyl-carrier-protein] synthase II